jgi:hypothetical protein
MSICFGENVPHRGYGSTATVWHSRTILLDLLGLVFQTLFRRYVVLTTHIQRLLQCAIFLPAMLLLRHHGVKKVAFVIIYET